MPALPRAKGEGRAANLCLDPLLLQLSRHLICNGAEVRDVIGELQERHGQTKNGVRSDKSGACDAPDRQGLLFLQRFGLCVHGLGDLGRIEILNDHALGFLHDHL